MTRSLRIFLVLASLTLPATGCGDLIPTPSEPSVPTKTVPRKISPTLVPLTADQARKHQQDEAERLGVPVEITNTIGMKLKLIPAGEFIMGSPDSEEGRDRDESPAHRVRITRPFYLGIHEITQAQWKSVMGTEPWRGKEDVKEGPNYAASYTNWKDAVEFCKKLSVREGRTYRLPTEAEWEYACRAGTNTAYYFGHSSMKLGNYAWYNKNTCNIGDEYAHEVGQKRPNAWGLYDMHGNVDEWCQDWYDGDYYKYSSASDPSGPTDGSGRVLRGGNWVNSPEPCRSAIRGGNSGDRDPQVGFRVALVAE